MDPARCTDVVNFFLYEEKVIGTSQLLLQPYPDTPLLALVTSIPGFLMGAAGSHLGCRGSGNFNKIQIVTQTRIIRGDWIVILGEE